MSFAATLDIQKLKQLDASNMAATIAAMPDHILHAVEIANTSLAGWKPVGEIRQVVLGGMGGSAIGGDLARSYFQQQLKVPFTIVRGYDLPGHVDTETLLIISSYSGETEESLSLYEEAVRRGIAPVCITSGGTLANKASSAGHTVVTLPKGFMPRAALGYSFASVLLILEACKLIGSQSSLLRQSASFAREYGSRLTTSRLDKNPALDLAKHLLHTVPVIYSAADGFDTINLRWRGQLQENAKHLAFGNLLPEMNHNEINGWEHPSVVIGNACAILLRSPEDEHPRVQERFEVVESILTAKGIPVYSQFAEGSNPLERMLSLIVLGDWVSYYLAILSGVDPTPIPLIDKLKSALG